MLESAPIRRAASALLLCANLAVACVWPASGHAATARIERLALDSTRSHVDFEVKVLWLVGVHGRFDSVHGTITIDHFRNAATVEAQVDANAVTMRSQSHQTWVKSAEFFDAQHYPQFAFVSEAIPIQRLQTGGQIDGVLTLRGISKHVRFSLIRPDCPASSGENCPIEAEGWIHRSDFGMSTRRGTLSDKVEWNFSIAVKPMVEEARP